MFRKYFTIITCITFIMFIILSFVFKSTNNLRIVADIHLRKKNHYHGSISDTKLNNLVTSINMNDFQEKLNPFLRERVVGTSSHELVKNYIIAEMRQLNWSVEIDAFHDSTPNKGKLLFTNVIATHNPSSYRHLVFACHYDSKLMDFIFIGATDSAVPCAMLIYLAKVLNNELQQLKSEVGLKFIFFDGEEAFLSWTDTDSLYGARHLSTLMEYRIRRVNGMPDATDLDRIDLFVLLDLLGASSPQFFSFFENTHRWYKLLVNIERRLKYKNILLSDKEYSTHQPYFIDHILETTINDDHEPFLKKGVPVLHIISVPFPEVWHKEGDNESAINLRTVKNLLIIFKLFIIQYLSGDTRTT